MCQPWEAENRIKEVQLDLFGTWASCHKIVTNRFPLLPAARSYTQRHRLRGLALQVTELGSASEVEPAHKT